MDIGPQDRGKCGRDQGARVDGKVEERKELGQLETLSGQRELIPTKGRNAGLDPTSSDSN